MKTQKSHLERQLQHSYELMIRRKKVQESKDVCKYQLIGWAVCGVWLMFSVISYFIF